MSEAIALGRVPEASKHEVSLQQAARVWVRVALLSFGGPAGQIAVMHRILVEEKAWISEGRFLYALNYCMLLPGPEAQQLATYIGWLMHRSVGGIVAGGLFIAPGIVAIMALSYVYAGYGNVPVIAALFFGLKAAVLAVVLEAVLRIGKRALKTRAMVGLAGVAFIAIFFFSVLFPVIIFGAAAAYRHSGLLSPMLAGTLGGLLATWVTFTPCFLWIFLGAPFVETLRANKAVGAAFSAITAAVVGVVLNLAVWFAIHNMFRETIPVRAFPLSFDAPDIASVDTWALALSVAAAVAIFGFRLGMIPTLAACCAAGVVLFLLGATA
jgi:chromate transport protein ChrA